MYSMADYDKLITTADNILIVSAKSGRRVMKTLRETEQEITINAPWGRIAGITWGHPDNPPVFICPGRISPCSSFRPLVVKLPINFFYVTVDLPGNGLSDHLPMGTRFTFFDLVPTVARVADHFKWKKFAYIGHSLGAVIGKHFLIAYPGRLTRVVDLDPVPAYHTVLPHEMKDWYHETFGKHYEQEGYTKHTSGKETAPKYTYEKIKNSVMKAQQLSEEAVEHLLPRYIEEAGDGLYRFTYDQRMKSMFKIPYLPNQLKEIYTSYNVPLLAILASQSLEEGSFSRVPFVQDETAWPFNNYKFKIVEGSHDVHTSNPDCMVDDISRFLLEEIKAKL